MYTKAVLKVGDPQDPTFDGLPVDLDSINRERIMSRLRLVQTHRSHVVDVEFTERDAYSRSSCGARNCTGKERVCVVTLRGFMPAWAARRAVGELLLAKARSLPIAVTWHRSNRLPTTLQTA